MKNHTHKILLALGLVAGPLMAETVAVVDPIAVAQSLPSMESIQKDMNKEFELAQSKMNNKKLQLEAKIQEYDSSKDTISDQKAQKLRKEIHALERELKYLEAELREDLAMLDRENQNMLLKESITVISDYAKKNKIDLVIRNSADIVLHAAESKDITAKIIEGLDKKFDKKK